MRKGTVSTPDKDMIHQLKRDVDLLRSQLQSQKLQHETERRELQLKINGLERLVTSTPRVSATTGSNNGGMNSPRSGALTPFRSGTPRDTIALPLHQLHISPTSLSTKKQKAIRSSIRAPQSLVHSWDKFVSKSGGQFTSKELTSLSCDLLRGLMDKYSVVNPTERAQIEAHWALLQEENIKTKQGEELLFSAEKRDECSNPMTSKRYKTLSCDRPAPASDRHDSGVTIAMHEAPFDVHVVQEKRVWTAKSPSEEPRTPRRRADPNQSTLLSKSSPLGSKKIVAEPCPTSFIHFSPQQQQVVPTPTKRQSDTTRTTSPNTSRSGGIRCTTTPKTTWGERMSHIVPTAARDTPPHFLRRQVVVHAHDVDVKEKPQIRVGYTSPDGRENTPRQGKLRGRSPPTSIHIA